MTIVMNLLNDPSFWVTISTLICFGFIAYKAYKPVLAGLDARAAAIRDRLAEAEALREEARVVLEDYKQKSANALKEAEAVLANAHRRAEQLREKMEDDLKESIARQEANAKSRLERLENETIESVKAAVIAATMERARQEMAQNDNAPSLTQSLDQITKTLN